MYNFINFMGCWSTAEPYFLDPNYYNREGIQNKALFNMVQKLTQPQDEAADYLVNNIANEDWGIFGRDIPITIWLYLTNFQWFTFTLGPLLAIGLLVQGI